jgi:hypothetical protein
VSPRRSPDRLHGGGGETGYRKSGHHFVADAVGHLKQHRRLKAKRPDRARPHVAARRAGQMGEIQSAGHPRH